jgi:hypothetical protein
MTGTAGRRLAAELTGTALLAAVITGSGIAVTRLTGDAALRLLVKHTTCWSSRSISSRTASARSPGT